MLNPGKEQTLLNWVSMACYIKSHLGCNEDNLHRTTLHGWQGLILIYCPYSVFTPCILVYYMHQTNVKNGLFLSVIGVYQNFARNYDSVENLNILKILTLSLRQALGSSIISK